MSGCFDIERIDLNSQGPGILQQDFLQRQLPVNESELFDIISLSLVLNFVPTPQDRGEMLRRTTKFLYASCHHADGRIGDVFPSVFLVLPTPCISNSRYLDQARLQAIMEGLGFALAKVKQTPRLSYTLWKRSSIASDVPAAFTKKEIRAGRTRNNFAIVLGEG
jgi:25S rRNA (adenine2142-N1)-methyltransferase